MDRHWIYWCRLCANDNANIDVRHKDVYMRLISKCFDVEIGREEPALGAMLCKDCYSIIGDFINFVENINKVQPIFELLRHIEPSEQLDVKDLRQQYGLQSRAYKMEPIDTEVSKSHNDSVECLLDDQDQEIEELLATPTPVKRKRGRPKGSTKKAKQICEKLNAEREMVERIKNEDELETEILDDYEEYADDEMAENQIWLEENEEIDDEFEEMDSISESYKSPTAIRSENLKVSNDSVSSNTGEMPVKRKRGRPRKHPLPIEKTDETVHINYSSCKNVALARLFASPVPGSTDLDDKQYYKPSFMCKICNKELSSEFGLKQHNERIHIKKKPVVCDCCGKRVNNSSELKEHMLVHTEERPFVCPVCHASFKNKKRLNIHSQTHGVPSYECDICGKKLQTRAIWNKHKYVHTNERRFKCSICGTATKHSTALKVHLLSHAGFRPYACKYCNKAFASGANCRDHKLKKHPKEFALDEDKSSRLQSVPTLDELRALAESMEKGERLRKPRNYDK